MGELCKKLLFGTDLNTAYESKNPELTLAALENINSYFPIAFHDLCGLGHEKALKAFLLKFDPPPEIKEAALACALGTDREETVKTKLGL
jgi:hypothetical protein